MQSHNEPYFTPQREVCPPPAKALKNKRALCVGEEQAQRPPGLSLQLSAQC